MKIAIYAKNRDVETVKLHMKDFKPTIKKGSKLDIYNQSLSNANYGQILNIYVANTYLIEALKTILELFKNSVDIRIVFKYGSFGNVIFVNYNEIEEFIINNDKSNSEAVKRLYQK